MARQRNLAARVGRWSAAHRKLAIFGWLAFVLAAVMLGGAAGINYQRDEDLGTGESGRADKIIAAGFADRASEQVLVQGRGSLTIDDPRFRAALDDVEHRLGALPFVVNVESPQAHGASLVSRDRRSTLVQFEIVGDSKATSDRIEPVLAAVARSQAAHPQLLIEEFGEASARQAISQAFEDDARQAETLSLPITLLILVAAFGALVAAGLPLLLGLTAVAATIGLLGPLSQIIPVAEAVTSIVLLVGLAVGVDYSMFYIRRVREERAAGRGSTAALEAAAATSGRAVLISGLTVIVAMSGMFVVAHPVFASFAIGTIMVVAVAMVGSITVLPAMLAVLGDRIDKGRLPLIGRRRNTGESGAWAAIIRRVLRRPWLAAGAATALLLVLAAPTLRLHTADPGAQALPRDLAVMRTYDRIQQAFPGGPLPAVVAVQIPRGRALSVTVALKELRERALATGLLQPPFGFSINDDRTIAVITMAVAGKGTDATSDRALAALRDEVLPASFAGKPGVRTYVTGTTAMSKDFNDLMKARAPWVFAFVLSLAFLLLLTTFRSLVIAITSVVLNLLSVGAAYGVLVWIFQDGHLESVLGFTSVGGIVSWLPLFLFVILFGLSMDYHVFILSRIREGRDRGMSTEDAVSHGIASTASVVTSAAIVMVAVFGIFATLRMLAFKQMGLGLALAVLIDATIVRAVLLPATMKLLGDSNWYLPKWLERLPGAPRERPAPVVAATLDQPLPSREPVPPRTPGRA
jgi:RND superfamily putative drug exporter